MWVIVLVSLLVVLWGATAFGLARYGRRQLPSVASGRQLPSVASGRTDRRTDGRPPRLQERYDAIVVLGCRVYRSGRPSLALVRRTERAIELYQAVHQSAHSLRSGAAGDQSAHSLRSGAAVHQSAHSLRSGAAGDQSAHSPTIVFTGGLGDAPVTEADAAADIARAAGVPRSAIVTEGRSTSTEENARFAAEASAARRVLVVTDAYHVFRAERVFARYFEHVRGVGSINPHTRARVRGALREVLAIAGYGVLGRL